jgi:hypothetical protein
MDGKDFEAFLAWQREKPESRSIDFKIEPEKYKTNGSVWAYDYALGVGQHVDKAEEINLEAVADEQEEETYERLRKKFAGE